MGRPKNPVDTYDDELWKSLHYLADLWNENPDCRKIIVQDYYSEMKYMMKHFGAYIESPIDLAITLFIEFFFINHDDGVHRYGYYRISKRRNDLTISETHEDGQRIYYHPFSMNGWFCQGEIAQGVFPTAMAIYNYAHLYNRGFMQMFIDKGLIDKEELKDDISEFKDFYSTKVYQAIDYRIVETPMSEIPDPFNVMKNGKLNELWNHCVNIGIRFMRLYENYPEMFEL